MKKLTIAFVVILVIIGAYMFWGSPKGADVVTDTVQTTNEQVGVNQVEEKVDKTKSVIGVSVEKRDIVAYHYGSGDSELLFVGGIHGGYEWNTALVAYKLMEYLKENPSVIPANLKVTVIPVLNPDGLNKVVGTTTGNFTLANVSTSQDTVVSGRFNGNNVDLNRNFDCDWQSAGKWQTKTVSGGSTVFSEPESLAVKNYVETKKPTAVVVWYSSADGVFSSNCHNGVLAETKTLTKLFADASGYPAYESFNFYEITGDMVNWLAKNNIPAISVLLKNHTDIEWTKNQLGVEALFKYYAR